MSQRAREPGSAEAVPSERPQDDAVLSGLENALAATSPERRKEVVERVADLFSERSEALNAHRLALFDSIFIRLVAMIETSARAILAQRLALDANAPPRILHRLAFDDAIEVAGPVLTLSARIADSELIENARIKGQEHLRAISRRRRVAEPLTDVIISRGDARTLEVLAGNQGARFSGTGISQLIERAGGCDDLALRLVAREDLPRHPLLRLLARASQTVRLRLEQSGAVARNEIADVVAEVTRRIQHKSKAASKNYDGAQALVASLRRDGRLDGDAITRFATAGQFEEAVAALANLSDLPIELIERAIGQERGWMVITLARGLGLSWSTTKALLNLGRDSVGLVPMPWDEGLAAFERLKPHTAQQVMKFQRAHAIASTER